MFSLLLSNDYTKTNCVGQRDQHCDVFVICEMYLTRICAAEMAVRYAALSACREVRMPSVRGEKYMCVIVIR